MKLLTKQLNIRSKIILMLLGVSISSIFVTAYIGYRSGKSNLTERIFSQLTSLRASKASRIESYFETLRNQSKTLSQDLMIVAAMKEFKETYQKLSEAEMPDDIDERINKYYSEEFLTRLAQTKEGEPVLESYTPKTPAARYLQYHYIANNPEEVGQKHLLDDPGDKSEYSDIHARYHPIFRDLIQNFGYDDMFLIDGETGAIVYSAAKQSDFAKSIKKRPYSQSNLAEATIAAKQANGTEYIKTVDFGPNRPSYGAPAAFIAAPIFDGGEFLGVLAFQLPVDEINSIMTGDNNWSGDGLGDSGEIYLVGEDNLMRSVSRFLVEDPENYTKTLEAIGVEEKAIEKIKQHGTSILQQQVQNSAVKEATEGKEGTKIVKDYRGISVLSSYAPLNIDGLQWVIISQMDLAEAYAPLYSFQKRVFISTASLVLAITLVAMLLARILIQPIETLIASSRKVRAGEIDAVVKLDSQDELAELADSFNEMIHSLRDRNQVIEEKNRENEELLLSVFPDSVAKRLKRGEKDIAENVSNVTVLFSDISGFTALSQSMEAHEVITILNDIVTVFDEATEKYGIEKIKTIGDNYMAVSGLATPLLDHDKRAVDFALEMLAFIHRFNHERGFNLDLRISINSGNVFAGIVGRHKFIYDVWGDTINVANTLKNTCPDGSILVSETIYNRLHDIYNFEQFDNSNEREKLLAWQLKFSSDRS